MKTITVIVLFATVTAVVTVRADVFSYECLSFPGDAGWQVIQEVCDPEQWISDGILFHEVEACEAFPPPGGQQLDYMRSLSDFDGANEFFIEWRLMTDGDSSEFTGAAPVVLAAGSLGAVRYNFTIASDVAKLNRDNLLPIVFVDIEPGVPHTHRLELFGDTLYVWYIDGVVVDSGIPEGAYPSFIPSLNWRTASWNLPNATQWDYIRYGTIPTESSGDFDSDDDVDADDLYFFCDCLLGPDADGPGCVWADMDGNQTVNGDDIQRFIDEMLAFLVKELKREVKQSVTLKVVRAPCQGASPNATVSQAIQECSKLKSDKDSRDSVWVVLDLEHEQHRRQQAYAEKQRAEGKGVSVALSEPCYEIWALLHSWEIREGNSMIVVKC